jgi:GNAT superfamily N-acetyltransferase
VSPVDEAALDRALQRAWPPRTTAAVGQWTARLDAGVTRRANSVLPHGEGPDLDDDALDALLAETVRLYARHGLTPWLQVTDTAWPPRREERLAARRWQTGIDTTLLLTGPVPVAERADEVLLEPQASADWIATWWSVDPRGGALEREVAVALLARIDGAAFAHVVEDSAVVGVGLGVVVGETLVVECLAAQPTVRRRGVATRVVSALGAWAAARGARSSLLAVQELNVAARSLYASLGFEEMGSYAYARPGPQRRSGAQGSQSLARTRSQNGPAGRPLQGLCVRSKDSR